MSQKRKDGTCGSNLEVGKLSTRQSLLGGGLRGQCEKQTIGLCSQGISVTQEAYSHSLSFRMPGAGPKVFPLIRYSWSGLGNWRNLNRKRLDSCSSMDLAVQSKGTGERVKRRAVLLSVDQHVLGTRSCLCAQPLFTLAVPLVCGSVNICIGRT